MSALIRIRAVLYPWQEWEKLLERMRAYYSQILRIERKAIEAFGSNETQGSVQTQMSIIDGLTRAKEELASILSDMEAEEEVPPRLPQAILAAAALEAKLHDLEGRFLR